MNAFANALLDSSRAAAWLGPNSSRPSRRKPIGDAEAQRQLRSDDGEVDLLARGKLQETRGVGKVSVHGAAERRHAGISGSADDLAPLALGKQAGSQRVLARTAAENQNSHDVKGLSRVER